jgi:hypothetical protein
MQRRIMLGGLLIALVPLIGYVSSYRLRSRHLDAVVPQDCNMILITAPYPDVEVKQQKLIFEMQGKDLHAELDKLVDFRWFCWEPRADHSCRGNVNIHFLSRGEVCGSWNFAHGNFVWPGLLTKASRHQLAEWFSAKGYGQFVEWISQEEKLENLANKRIE